MRFIEKELNAGIELDFGDFVLFNGSEVAVVSYNNEEKCGLTFLSNGYFRSFDNCDFKCEEVKEFGKFLMTTYKGIRFVKSSNIVIREV